MREDAIADDRPREAQESVVHRFEAIAREHAQRLAVADGTRQISYDELDLMANQIAHAILERDVTEPQQRVLLLLEQSPWMIAAILGTLKAGHAYVPLDPKLPRKRIDYIAEDSAARVIITNRRNRQLADALGAGTADVIDVDTLTGIQRGNPGIALIPERLTWIIYTSGSTGNPKGVMQNHRNVLEYVRVYTEELHLAPEDRVCLLMSPSTNAAAHELFSTLLNGASLHLVDLLETGIDHLAQWLGEERISRYTSVPTVFRQLTNTLASPDDVQSVRVIKLMGEPVSRRDVNAFKRNFHEQCVLINRLGSTETGSVLWKQIRKDTTIDGSNVPVGRCLGDHEVVLLDQDEKPVPSGEVGEIAIRSRFLSPGYWRLPDKTASVFLPSEGEKRMFLSGDLGRWLPSGELSCAGRKDFQVKIRGFRIELVEIELALLDLDLVRDCAVIKSTENEEHSRLVAYVVPAKGATVPASDLRRLLTCSLPAHMIPALFVFMSELPTAPNGKVIRSALPNPPKERPSLGNPHAPPETMLEEELVKIWEAVLDLAPVGIHDKFLELGGDSMSAMRVSAQVRELLGENLSFAIFFESETVAQLAERLEESAAHPAQVDR